MWASRRLYLSPDSESLVLGCENGNIDLIRNNTILNIADIKDAALIEEKKINAFEIKDEEASGSVRILEWSGMT